MLSCAGEHWCCVACGRGSQDARPGMGERALPGAKERVDNFLCPLKAFLVTWACYLATYCSSSHATHPNSHLVLHMSLHRYSQRPPFLRASTAKSLAHVLNIHFLEPVKATSLLSCPQPSPVGSAPSPLPDLLALRLGSDCETATRSAGLGLGPRAGSDLPSDAGKDL